MRLPRRWLACLGSALLCAGCTTFSSSVYVQRPGGAPFTPQEQDAARAIVVEIGRAAGFRETPPEPTSSRASGPYRELVSLGGVDFEQDSVSVWAAVREDGREIRVVLGDDVRGEPLPATQKLIGDLRAALAHAFPDAHVEVKTRKLPRVLGP